MRFRNVSHLISAPVGRSVVFLAQRIDELTFDYSLDSYKAPSVSVPSLVAEALQHANLLQESGEVVPTSSLDPIIDELKVRLAANAIVKAIIPQDRNVLDRLDADLDLLVPTLNIIANELNPFTYTATVMNLIVAELERGSKESLDFLARELVATLENMGMSRAHIYFANKRFFYDEKNKINSSEEIKEFFEVIFPHYHEFTVALKVSSFSQLIDEEHFSAFGLELKSDARDDFENLDPEHPSFALREEQVFLLCDGINALDRYSAIEKAVEKASLLQNLFRLYHHAQTFQIDEQVIVSQCCIDIVSVCNRTSNKMLNVEDERPLKAGAKLKGLVTGSALLRGADSSRFISLAEFHGMGLESATVENQIINLWISLETISPSRKGHSKIRNVTSAILPVTGLCYANRLVRRMAFDLYTWSRHRTSVALKGVEPATNTSYGKVLSLLTDKQYEPQLVELFERLEDFELLRYRLFRIRQIFVDPSKLLSLIDSHQRRVEWQLRRIYRARNSIVHRGEKPPFINQLVDNAHDYLDQAINTTISVSTQMTGMETYEQCFDYLIWEYEVYRRRLEGLEEFDANSAEQAIWRRQRSISRKHVLGN